LTILQDPIFSSNTTEIPLDRVLLPIQFMSFASGGPAAISAVCAVLIALFGPITILLLWHYGETPFIRRSSPIFLALISVGLMFACISTFFWFGDLTVAHCHLRTWLAFVGATVSYGALLAKNWRLYQLFNDPGFRVIAITNQKILGIVGGITTPMVLVLILWSSLQPFRIVQQLNAQKDTLFLTCVSQNDKFSPESRSVSSDFSFIDAVLSFKTRTLPDTMNESRYIAFSTYNLLISFEPSATHSSLPGH
jgi:hypothetical protein